MAPAIASSVVDPPGPAPANELFNKAVIGFITNPAG
jgi:hypothetical protein